MYNDTTTRYQRLTSTKKQRLHKNVAVAITFIILTALFLIFV